MHSIKLSGYRIGTQFDNSVLAVKQNKYVTRIVNAYIVYDLDTWPKIPYNIFKLKVCLFDTTNLVKNSGKSKYAYSGYGIAFDGASSWSFGNDFTENDVIFGVDNSSPSYVDNCKNNV